VYWITLSELTPHKHIHVFPRWPEDSDQGLPLFESRYQPGQPEWTETARTALENWSADFSVALI
jgi:hypothetical protein